MQYLVLGAGMMGSAVAYDIAHSDPDATVILADKDANVATRSAASIGPTVRNLHLDILDKAGLRSALKNCDAAISAASYSVNEEITKAAIAAGVHMCDLGGNNDVLQRQLALHQEAVRRGVLIVPNCGLAPGLVNILAVIGARGFETLDTIQLRVGGLPQHPRPPLQYQITFSVEGLINEYLEKAEVIRDGVPVLVDSLSELEEIEFPPPFGTMEAFVTSGGISTLASLFKGRVKTLDYKTIRYPGHCEKMKTLFDLGFASPEPLFLGGTLKTARELFTELLRRRLTDSDKDVVLGRVRIDGTASGVDRTLEYEWIDYYDDASKMTAMMRTTAFPTSIIAQMLAHGKLTVRGVMPPEVVVTGDAILEELRKRGIVITTRVSEATKS